ncbi:hypothetical protein HNH97_09970 [Gluconacetobacter entanii]|nr:hypothetical protein [Gluconacetobacter entanii]
MQPDLLDALSPSTSGKTFPASCRTKPTRSEISLQRLQDARPPSFRHQDCTGPARVWLLDPDEQSHGVCWTLNISAWPNDASVCSLWQVLWGGADPTAILFEPESLPGNPAPRRGTGENIAPTVARGSPGGRVYGLDADTVESLQVHPVAFGGGNCSGPIDVARSLLTSGLHQDFETETFITHTLRGEGFDASEDGTGRGTPLVPVAFDCKASGQNGFGVGDIASTMRAMGHAGSYSNGGGHLAVMQPLSVALRGRDGGSQIEVGDDVAHTLRASQGGSDKPHVLTSAVRRLMPVECERLQGFADDHTDVPNGNRPAADGPRYKALGNSMPVPVLHWILTRVEREIAQVREIR